MIISWPSRSWAYLFRLRFVVSPIGRIPARQVDNRSPGLRQSRWRDHRQAGQWLRFCTPAMEGAHETYWWHCTHLNSCSCGAIQSVWLNDFDRTCLLRDCDTAELHYVYRATLAM